jgi:hypothetical protein
MEITNFGGNVSYEPAHYYEPRTEGEVLEILGRHAGGTVRVVASGHSWSPAIETPDTAIRVDNLNRIVLRHDVDGVVVRAGGGERLGDLVRAVESHTDYTVPTLGGIVEQTIFGTILDGDAPFRPFEPLAPHGRDPRRRVRPGVRGATYLHLHRRRRDACGTLCGRSDGCRAVRPVPVYPEVPGQGDR